MARIVTPPANASENAALLAYVADTQQPQLVELKRGTGDAASVVALPDHLKLHSAKHLLDEYAAHPERRKGTATFTALDSFIEHTKRFADEHSAVFAEDYARAPALRSVLDYHEKGAGGTPRFGAHRALYRFPLSDEWVAWFEIHRSELKGERFAEFLEDRISDVVSVGGAGDEIFEVAERLQITLADASQLMALSRGLSVHVNARVAQHANLASGEGRVQFEVTHAGADGQALKVPGGFGIQIPIFRGGPLYKLAVRLRYRVSVETKAITWTLVLHRTDLVFRHAFDKACALVAEQTGLPVLLGTPESE